MTFDEFVDANLRALLGMATAMSGDAHLGEDLVQDVLMKAHQRWTRVGAVDDPLRYVRRMLVNEYVSWRRKWARLVPFADVRPRHHEPDHAQVHADRSALAGQLGTLTRTQRAVLAMRFYADMDDSEIAGALGCGESTVRSHASRALAALRADPEPLIPSRNGESRGDH